MELGALTGCHQMESRSFSFKGYQFPVCARCTGLFVGQMSAIGFIIAGIRIPIIGNILLMAVMGIDWLIQKLKIKMSSNIRRLITGIMCGIGVTYLYFYVIRGIYRFIKRFFV
ncbi:MAG: DUF2085 domain-containing protein [Eubacterium sp.]|nr:DUF2085 domain-containing protein [Eubacterium sp.]